MHDGALGSDGARVGGSGSQARAAALSREAPRASLFFSTNAEKAFDERILLLASPVWIAAVAFVVLSGWLRSWGEGGYLAFSIAAMTPMTIVPLAIRARRGSVAGSYVLKLNLYVAILVFFGTYVGTHYFFDLMGMRYAFPTRFVFDAEIVGRSGAHVPVFMYPLTQAYFMTYFTVLVVLDRGLGRLLRLGRVGRAGLVGALAYSVAFAETFFMATDWMKDLFSYEKHGKMLALGSVGYALYFVVGLPAIRNLDESATWPLRSVVERGLAASMLVFFLLEAWAKLVGKL